MQDHRTGIVTELVKAWRWVVFMVQLLGQMGGPGGILRALARTITILLERALRG
ncbi:MAG: hypothetical protein Q6L50_05975 [Gloeomargarita sp. GMQP_bins_120]